VATLRFTVADADAGARLDKALAARPEIGTRSLSERLLRSGAVRVDGSLLPKSHRLDRGSVVEVELPADEAAVAAGPVSVRVAYEDEHLVVIDKSAGVAVHPAPG
jgi:23S rRNA pseudouridine1911/1915/1917 synthase